MESLRNDAFNLYDESLMVVIASHLASLADYTRLREEAEGRARNLGLIHEVVQQVIGLTDTRGRWQRSLLNCWRVILHMNLPRSLSPMKKGISPLAALAAQAKTLSGAPMKSVRVSGHRRDHRACI